MTISRPSWGAKARQPGNVRVEGRRPTRPNCRHAGLTVVGFPDRGRGSLGPLITAGCDVLYWPGADIPHLRFSAAERTSWIYEFTS